MLDSVAGWSTVMLVHGLLGVAHDQRLLQLLPALLDLTVEVAADGFLGPGLVVELSPAFLFRVTGHICHDLEVSALRAEQILDVAFGVSGET